MWQYRGYAGSGNVDSIVGSLEGRTAIIVGAAEGVFEEFREAHYKSDNPVVFACNDVGMYLNPLDHWVSIHGDQFLPWTEIRRLELRPPATTHGCNYGPKINHTWIHSSVFKLSGYFAMQIAWLMGADKIILCGIPGHPARRFFDTKMRAFGYGDAWTKGDRLIKTVLIQEMEQHQDFKKAVRSMSGWTQCFFGGVK